MDGKNRHSEPFILVVTVTILLFILSLVKTEINLFGYKTKKISLLGNLLASESQRNAMVIQLDSTSKLAVNKDTLNTQKAASLDEIVDYKNDSSASLEHFFQALAELKRHKRKVRIAYFGDSMIEGDLISQDLRESFQDNFGGDGVGFMPVTSIVAGFRSSIVHSFEGWTTYNLLENPTKGHMLGISGYDFVPDTSQRGDSSYKNSASWVKYTAVNRRHLNRFYTTKLLYGKSKDENYVSINGTQYKLNQSDPVNQLVLNNGLSCQSITAKFSCKSPVDIFGFSMESDSGVFVDNFSFRGNSGMPLIKVAQSIYKGTNACLNYDLIILEYGLNVVSPGVTDYAGYIRAMSHTIRHIHESFPNASILLVSIGDKSNRIDGVYATDTSVPVFVNVQQQIAQKNAIAYWSLYDAMGGKGTMVNWVEGDTVLANKDYTHFNFKGAHKVGKLLYHKLMNKYTEFSQVYANN